ncbi:MAG: hypothetical protein AUK51_16330 [Comamonadaceae bacterium CG2_30_59_20]|nr:MAG: hypothetical protein AUK51_16330 [Comamonadaceae bacterium CG2_30_59_20]
MAKLIVDSRETTSGMMELLTAGGAQVVVEELACADYILTEGMAVERKTAEDFAASIMDRRLFLQIAMLKATYAKVFILIEGDMFDTQSAIAPEAITGALSYITVIEGIPVVATVSPAHSAAMMITMQRHAIEGLGYEIPLRGPKPKSRAPQAQFLIEGLPGVGPSAAKKLLAHFGSAQGVLAATPDQFKAVRGIGPKTIANIREVLEFKL